MTRRADPERIHAARRAATFRRLVDVRHLDELDAEHWLSRWERENPERTRDYWRDAEEWVAANWRHGT